MKGKLGKILLTAAVACSLSTTVYAAGLKDINIPWAKSAITNMVNSGVITGYKDNTFRPNNQISRAEFVTLVNKAFSKYNENADAKFSDVFSYQWFYHQVASAKNAEYITGYPNNTFAPNKSITRAEAAAMIARLLQIKNAKIDGAKKYTDMSKMYPWAIGSISALSENGVMTGYTDRTFKPARYITRAEAVVMVTKAKNLPATSAQ
ncbi:S-layer homology domain-containing protein [Aneurinibacillus sp. Ricciae_BoGa-3]|uniref:S-layer homology domain-containing protein n=1 Tax=Aneurinibacillus sp. Ricciae_BoGa-3 TaxID=3022697 RepID=UPI002340B267|nr:S-layer homology domain-containing protein [Aneurinibacillus sp. Ricciae_BoGa-3]WCK54947.1 S-layer homology domain-containing protein [Aneurinibacillus sp. Ricciae_BoGa-3]